MNSFVTHYTYCIVLLAIISTAKIHAIPLTTYQVMNTSVDDCKGSVAGHGLWTASSFGSAQSCKNFFSVQDGSTLTVYDDNGQIKADLDVTTMNIDGVTAVLDFTFGGMRDTYEPFKTEEIDYDPITDLPNWTFFTTIDSARISFDNAWGDYTDFDFATEDEGTFVFQLGIGANHKDSMFGASTWISPEGYNGHWDINISLPEPGSMYLIGLGVLCILFGRRKLLHKHLAK